MKMQRIGEKQTLNHLAKKFVARSFDDTLQRTVAVVYAMLLLVNTFAGGEKLIPIPISTVSLVLKGIIAVCLLCSVRAIIAERNSKILIAVLALCAVFVIQRVFFRQLNSYFIGTFITMVTTCFPLFVLVLEMKNTDGLYDKLLFTSVLSVLFTATFIIILKINNLKFFDGEYAMGFSYALLMPTLLFVNEFVNTKKLFYAFLFILSTLMVVMYGARGPVLCIAIYVFLKSYRMSIQKKQAGIFLALCLMIVILLLTYKYILTGVNNLLLSRGITIRTIALLIADDSVDISSGRTEIYRILINSLLESPFSVRGINAEFPIVGAYAHNIVLELVYQFGVIFSLPIIVCLALFSFNSVFVCTKDKEHELVFVAFCATMPCLMISGSLWTEINFWFWLPLCIRLYSYSRQVRHAAKNKSVGIGFYPNNLPKLGENV